MKNRSYDTTKRIFYILISIVFIFASMLGFHLLSPSRVEIPSILSRHQSQTTGLISTGITEHCEIIVNEPTEEYLQTLHLTYPHCKIIQKQNIYQFDLINYLLDFLN